MLRPRDAVQPPAKRARRDNERQRSQHRALRDATREADIFRQRVVHPPLRRGLLQKTRDPRHQMPPSAKWQKPIRSAAVFN
ncbi:hypothetical protein ERJ75_000101000 [Trypanosoma vivax]|nr:hypothetical protein ERJ75_000101000 [Trypanosoma vivax]